MSANTNHPPIAGDRAAEMPLCDGIEVEQSDGVLTVRLSRPERKNALTFDSYQALGRVFRAVNNDLSVSTVLLTGAGDSFCSGGDVDLIARVLATDSVEDRLRFTRMTGQITQSIRDCEVPVIAAIRGPATGAGAVLALAADLRIACEGAYFQFLFNRLGLAGADMGSAYLLSRLIGSGRALEILLSGRRISVIEAERIGLVHQVHAEAAWTTEIETLVATWSTWPRTATTTTKRALALQLDVPASAAFEMDAYMQAVCLSSDAFLSRMD